MLVPTGRHPESVPLTGLSLRLSSCPAPAHLALEVDGSYRMATLMRDAISQGLPPWVRRAHVA